MINKIEIVIVKNGVRHILQPEVADSENYYENIASMICDTIDMCDINRNYITEELKSRAKWEKEQRDL